jgi:uncharacterized phosphosugar-binding protein
MYLDDYFGAVEETLERIRTTQLGAIRRAAEMVAQSLAKRGTLHIMDTGHMLKHEAFFRAGGMMAIVPFSYELKIENPADQRKIDRDAATLADIEAKTVAVALDSSKVKAGDVILINSNSGRTSNVIEVALQCRGRGVHTIGLVSTDQMNQCTASHPSGKKLGEVVDLLLDNCGPYGDAAVEVRDNEKMCPMSGIAGAYIFWAIHAETVELLQAQNVNPTIFRSVHVSGIEYIDKQREKFMNEGI